MNRTMLLALPLLVLLATGCRGPQGTTTMEKRDAVGDMRDEVLASFYAEKPGLQSMVRDSAGYGVFSNLGFKIFLAGTGQGYGLVHNNRTNVDTYMRMAELNVGLGIGGKDYRTLFVFHDEAVLNKFVESGWEFGGDADAGAEIDRQGASAGAAGSVSGMDIYMYTETGVVLAATVGGTKYWKDKDLN